MAGEQEEAEGLFVRNCAVCHGADRGGYIGPALTKENLKPLSEAALRTMIMTGVMETLMPPWGGKLAPPDIRKLAVLIKNTSKAKVSWGMEDIQKSLEIYVADESSLPSQPTYAIEDLDDLMAVMSRGRYSAGNCKVVFFDGRTHVKVGEIPTSHAPHLVDYSPTEPRWAYVKTDSGHVYKVDLYSMQATRRIQTGFNGPPLAVSRDGRYVVAGSFVPHTAVILDAKTLEPVKFLELKGIDPDGSVVESRSGMVTGTPFADCLVIALKDAGQVWIIEYDKPGMPVTKVEKVGRRLHDAFLSPDGRYLMVASYEDNLFSAVDLKEKKIVKKIPGGCQPHVGSGAVVKVKGRTLGVGTNIGSCDKSVVSVWDLDTWQVVKQISVLGPTESPAAHPQARYIVVDIVGAGPNADKIQLIDKENLEVVKTIAVGGHSHFPEYTARGDYLYVSAGYQGDKVVIYKSDTFERVADFSMEVPAGIFSHVRPKTITVGLEKSID
ncbi:MAG: cytochrome D1 domain-containing protein [candidate division NC10 bacterium]|nr:cytochrome D1 domain-containing protein [candidate division NC10 bacterium]